jgi:hypothetical protein
MRNASPIGLALACIGAGRRGAIVVGSCRARTTGRSQSGSTWRPVMLQVAQVGAPLSFMPRCEDFCPRVRRTYCPGTLDAIDWKMATQRKLAAHESPSDVSLTRPRTMLPRHAAVPMRSTSCPVAIANVWRWWMRSRECARGTYPLDSNDGPIHGRLTSGNSGASSKGARGLSCIGHPGWRSDRPEPGPRNVHMKQL